MADSICICPPGWQAKDGSTVLSGALLDLFLEETTDDLTSYSNAALSASLPNPIVCNSSGFPTSDGNALVTVWVGTQNYRFRLRRADGTTVWDFDKQPGAQVSAASIQGFEIGLVVPSAFLTAPSSRWLPFNGGTIGSANSGANLRASDSQDTATTFAGLWVYDGTYVPIYDSAGSPTTRGLTAAADFAANKRLQLLDACGRAIFFADNMAGVASKNRLTGLSGGLNGDIPGFAGGDEKFTLAEADLPVIDPDGKMTDPTHLHSYSRRNTSGTGGPAAGSTGLDTSASFNTGSASTGITFSNIGSGSAKPHLPPGLVLPLLLIYAGAP